MRGFIAKIYICQASWLDQLCLAHLFLKICQWIQVKNLPVPLHCSCHLRCQPIRRHCLKCDLQLTFHSQLEICREEMHAWWNLSCVLTPWLFKSSTSDYWWDQQPRPLGHQSTTRMKLSLYITLMLMIAPLWVSLFLNDFNLTECCCRVEQSE